MENLNGMQGRREDDPLTRAAGGAIEQTFDLSVPTELRPTTEQLAAQRLGEAFNSGEVLLLCALQERHASPYGEFGLDESRLRYVRWLLEHGRIGEQISPSESVD